MRRAEAFEARQKLLAHKRRRRGKRVSIGFFVPDAQAISSSEQVRHKIHMEAWDPRSFHHFEFYL